MPNINYSLANYFNDAGITELPLWFSEVYMRHKPWGHQVEDLKFCHQHERFGLFNDAGTGKTLPMQALLILYTAGYGNKGIVCMPPALIGQFMESFFHADESYFLGLSRFVNFKAYVGTKKVKDTMMAKWKATKVFPELLVMSYNAFSDMHPIKPRKEKVITNSRTGKSHTRPAIKPLRVHPMQTIGYNVLFFDESQALKNASSGISKKVWKWVGNSSGETILGLFTGSPIPNVLEDAFGTLKLLTPAAYPTMRSFEKEHCIYSKKSESMFRVLIGYQNEDVLHRNLYAVARRVTKQEALKDLPPMIPEAIPVELSPTHRFWYKKLLTERVLDLPDKFIDATQQQQLRQTALQMITTPEQFIPKKVENEVLKTFDAKINSIDPEKNKIIVFAYFKGTIEFLVERYQHLNPAVINGASGSKEKARIKFRNDDDCRIIFINWLSGGAGLNLQISSHIVFYETPTVPSQALQAIARSHRGGQDKPVNVTFFKVLATLMAKSLKQLLKKDYQVNTVVQDKHEMLHELLGE